MGLVVLVAFTLLQSLPAAAIATKAEYEVDAAGTVRTMKTVTQQSKIAARVADSSDSGTVRKAARRDAKALEEDAHGSGALRDMARLVANSLAQQENARQGAQPKKFEFILQLDARIDGLNLTAMNLASEGPGKPQYASWIMKMIMLTMPKLTASNTDFERIAVTGNDTSTLYTIVLGVEDEANPSSLPSADDVINFWNKDAAGVFDRNIIVVGLWGDATIDSLTSSNQTMKFVPVNATRLALDEPFVKSLLKYNWNATNNSHCFPGSSYVNTAGKGPVQMNTLRVGDQISTASTAYEEVLGFIHVDQASNEADRAMPYGVLPHMDS